MEEILILTFDKLVSSVPKATGGFWLRNLFITRWKFGSAAGSPAVLPGTEVPTSLLPVPFSWHARAAGQVEALEGNHLRGGSSFIWCRVGDAMSRPAVLKTSGGMVGKRTEEGGGTSRKALCLSNTAQPISRRRDGTDPSWPLQASPGPYGARLRVLQIPLCSGANGRTGTSLSQRFPQEVQHAAVGSWLGNVYICPARCKNGESKCISPPLLLQRAALEQRVLKLSHPPRPSEASLSIPFKYV